MTWIEREQAAGEVWDNFRAWYKANPSKEGMSWEEVCEAMNRRIAALNGNHYGVSVLADYCDDFQFVFDVLAKKGIVREAADEDAEYVLKGDMDAVEEVLSHLNSTSFLRS